MVTHFGGTLAVVFCRLSAFLAQHVTINWNTFSVHFHVFHPQILAIFTLTMHLSFTMAIDLCSLKYVCKASTNFFFLFHNFMDRWFLLTIDPFNFSIHFYFLLSWELSIFHLRKTLYSISLAYLNHQHHYSRALVPLLSTVSDRWTQLCDALTAAFMTKMATKWLTGGECL